MVHRHFMHSSKNVMMINTFKYNIYKTKWSSEANNHHSSYIGNSSKCTIKQQSYIECHAVTNLFRRWPHMCVRRQPVASDFVGYLHTPQTNYSNNIATKKKNSYTQDDKYVYIYNVHKKNKINKKQTAHRLNIGVDEIRLASLLVLIFFFLSLSV